DTFHRRPNGLRADLAAKLASVHPAFIRFPGGCYVEGDKLQDAFQWKKSLGNPALRPGHWDLWGYHSTDGLGFFEYLQMCEDLHAQPLFGFNCGMSHTANVPLDQLQPWIQSALDAIEFANGAVTTKFGALRARYGHPRPFNLRLVEVGNEESGPAYNARYAMFYDALKAHYPYLRLIATWPVTSRPMDYLDEHYYASPQWFFQNAARYDSYKRSGPRIFVGEYAVTQDCGHGNLRAAVAEAAFMTGLERNSDIVRMASYAPLFVNVHDRFWNPDAIQFNDAHSWGTPSYYVQQMFGRNRPTVMLPLKLRQPAPAPAAASGGIGLGTWNTQAVFRNVRVTAPDGARLLNGPLTVGSGGGFAPQSGAWSNGDDGLEQTAPGDNHFGTAGDPSWTNYTLTLDARKLGGSEGFLVMFHVKDARNWTWWNIGGWANTQDGIEKSVDGGKSLVGGYVPDHVETGRWYRIRIQVAGATIRCWLDGRLVESVTDAPPPSLFASAGIDSTHRRLIITVVNSASANEVADVQIPALGRRSLIAEQQVLTAASPDAENTASDPAAVAPRLRAPVRLRAAFAHTFPAWSVTVLSAPLGRISPAAR
ncbi:MAG: alpha-N-arabinofuranosidase, partial [Armatimonadetes bacterium]|nr:alpha-N-arabinofuranosidase [Armatimonadota bacterium]